MRRVRQHTYHEYKYANAMRVRQDTYAHASANISPRQKEIRMRQDTYEIRMRRERMKNKKGGERKKRGGKERKTSHLLTALLEGVAFFLGL